MESIGIDPSQASLESLPSELLLLIFDGEVDLDLPSLPISRHLLPFARLNFYRDVKLMTLRQISLFGQTVEENGEIGGLVRFMSVSYKCEDKEDGSGSGDVQDTNNGRSASIQETHTPGSSSSGSLSIRYRSNAVLDEDRLITFFRRLTNLTELILVGRKLAVIFRSKFYIPGVASRLEYVKARLRKDDYSYHHYDDEILASARKLPAVKTLLLTGFGYLTRNWGGKEEDNQSFSVLPSRNWGLKTLSLSGYLTPHSFNKFNPMSFLFNSFDSLQFLTIQLQKPHAALPEILSYAPSTLVSLDIQFGPLNDHPTRTPPVIPKFDNLVQIFPRIRHLRLGGVMFTSNLIRALSAAPSLLCFHLELRCPLFPPEMLALVSGPRRSKTLEFLEIDIEHLGTPPSSRMRPRWDRGMSRKEAKALRKAAAEAGVAVDGTILCALQLCGGGRDESHYCARKLGG